MLHLIQSNKMEALSALLAKEIAHQEAGTPIFMPEQILVQSPGMSTWLRLEIAKHNQIAAALEFPLPSSFIWQLCHTLLPDVPKENAFTKPAMTWKLMALLPSLLSQTEFVPLAQYLADEGPLKLYQLAGRIADVFDQYLVYRPDWILAWENNELPFELAPSQAWQPILWRALVEHNKAINQANRLETNANQGNPNYHRANLHQALFAALDDPNTCLDKLPKRLFVFGISSMAPQTLEVLHHLAKRISVVVLNLSPCQHYWGDIIEPKLRARMALAFEESKKLPPDWESLLEVGNPILANNGKMGRELLDLMLALPESHTQFDQDLFIDSPCSNQLEGVQQDILQLETRGQMLGPDSQLYLSLDGRRELAKDDNSITIRSCHSPLREVETLHDHLLEMLSQNPDLAPKDIVVMLPDVASYAPYIDAVFAAKQGQHYIPYAIADRGAAQESPLINSFLHLLAIDRSRFGLSEIISILEVPAILRRFNLDDDDLTLIKGWLEQAAVRWGRDEIARQEQSLPSFIENSWAFGIKRLLLGYAFQDDASLYLGSLPLEGIQGQSTQAIGKLLDFIEQLDEHKTRFLDSCQGEQRIIQLESVLDNFYLVEDDEREQLQTIRDAIIVLKEELLAAGLSHPQAHRQEHSQFEVQALNIQVLQHWFNARLSESRVGQRYLAGSVNFCTLMPMRSIPFKLVALLGMNDGVYPRVQHPVGFDLVAQQGPRKGDRSRRLDDRYLFLEALLSAREQLYISYIGHSERDNSERIPSMLVSELIEYCQLCYLPQSLKSEAETAQHWVNSKDQHHQEKLQLFINKLESYIYQQLVTPMPLQPFDPRLYLKQNSEITDDDNASPEVQLSYSEQWCPVTNNITGQQQFMDIQALKEEVTTDTPQEPQDNELALSSLIRFYRNPSQYFLNRSMGVNLSLDIRGDNNDEPFSLNALERYQLQDLLLNNAIDHACLSPDAELIAKLKADGSLPLAPFDDLLLNQYLKDLRPLIDRSLYLLGIEPTDAVEHKSAGQMRSTETQYTRTLDLAISFNTNTLNVAQSAHTGVGKTRLAGRLDNIAAKGLVSYRPGTAHGRDLVRLYLRHLCMNAMGHEKPSYLLDIGHFHSFSALTQEQAKNQLANWLAYFNVGQSQPLCFMPRTSLAYIQAEGDHVAKLIEAQSEWLDEQTGLGEGAEPHNQRLFEFPQDFSEQGFGQLASTLLEPMVSLLTQDKLAQLADFVE